MEKEQRELKSRIDSLWMVIDSLETRLAGPDSTVFESTGIDFQDLADTLSLKDSTLLSNTDSLLSIWYHHRRVREYEAPDYDMDSVSFDSNVSDSTMIERLKKMNSFITLPFNETVKNYMILYSETVSYTHLTLPTKA